MSNKYFPFSLSTNLSGIRTFLTNIHNGENNFLFIEIMMRKSAKLPSRTIFPTKKSSNNNNDQIADRLRNSHKKKTTKF
jgi:hypothetical protein